MMPQTLPRKAGPHTHSGLAVNQLMLTVVIALLPATLWGLYLFGWPAVFLFCVTVLSAMLFEALCLRLYGRPVRATLADGSALLTGWLFAMTLPPYAPWWVGVLGSFFAIVVGKAVFGGLGQNVFNPAMLARVMVLISFPLELTRFTSPAPIFSEGAPGFIASLKITFAGVLGDYDALTSATVLGHVKTELGEGATVSAALEGIYSAPQALFGWMAGSLGETSALLLLLGGVFMLARRIITWHIPVSMLGTVVILSGIFHFLYPDSIVGLDVHLLSGALMLGAFFIATDLVTSPTTPLGQIIFGAGCGLFTWVIRNFGGYPEAIGFSVLLMNALTPVIDHYTRPRIYGRTRQGKARDVKPAS